MVTPCDMVSALTAWGGWCYVIWRVAFVVRSSPRGNLVSSNVVSDRFSLKCGTNTIVVGQPKKSQGLTKVLRALQD